MTVINTNIASLQAQVHLNRARADAEIAMERLSSGQRINSAADDAAGLSIAARMTSQITGIKSAIKNAHDGISLADVAEGALDEVTNMLQRMRELSLQAANDTNMGADRDASHAEIDQLSQEIDRIANTTAFNDKKLLDGSNNTVHLQVGSTTESDATIDITLDDMTASNLGVNSLSVSSNTDALASVDSIDAAIETVNAMRSGLGAVRNRLDHAINNLQSISTNTQAARSRVTDADYSEEASNMTKNQILNQASTAMLAQANKISQSVLSLLQ